MFSCSAISANGCIDSGVLPHGRTEGKIKKSDVNPAHVNINKVLSELDMDIFKLKNQFFIDAATYYIEHFGREALIEPKEKKEPQFISTEEKAIRD